MPQGRLTLERSQRLKVTDMGAIQRNPTDLDGQIYATDPTGQCIADYSADNVFDALYTEAVYVNEEIYPSHISTIKTVTKVKDHFEVNSDFDYTSLRLEGEQMQVVFQTGNLAGRTFDARHYTATSRLAIVPKEEDDTTLPNDTLSPKVGDQYIVTGIKLPDKYITEAQRKLTDAALRHMLQLQRQRYSYKAEIDPVYLHNNKTTIGTKLDVGKYVHLTDPQIAIGDPYIRIIAKRTYLDRPYTPEIELSNEVERLSLLERLIQHTDGILADRQDLIASAIRDSREELDLVAGSLHQLNQQYSIEARTSGSPILKSDTDTYVIKCRIVHIPTSTDYTDVLLRSAGLISPEWYRINPEGKDRNGLADEEWANQHRGHAEVVITRDDFITSCTVGYTIPRDQIINAIKALETRD